MSSKRRYKPDQHPVRPRLGRKKKDTWRWCRGRSGVPHKPTIEKIGWGAQIGIKCGDEGLEGWKHCWHQVVCAVCDKFMGDLDPADCPDLKDEHAGDADQG
jgi:hypothetical protein